MVSKSGMMPERNKPAGIEAPDRWFLICAATVLACLRGSTTGTLQAYKIIGEDGIEDFAINVVLAVLLWPLFHKLQRSSWLRRLKQHKRRFFYVAIFLMALSVDVFTIALFRVCFR